MAEEISKTETFDHITDDEVSSKVESTDVAVTSEKFDQELEESDEYEESESEDEMDEVTEYNIDVVEESEIYVVTRDDKVVGYCKVNEEAQGVMWRLAMRDTSHDHDFSTHMEVRENRIEIYTHYNWWIVSWPRLQHVINVFRVSEVHAN